MLRSIDIQDEREFYLTVEEMKIFVAQLLLLVKLDLKHNGIASFDIEVLKGGLTTIHIFLMDGSKERYIANVGENV